MPLVCQRNLEAKARMIQYYNLNIDDTVIYGWNVKSFLSVLNQIQTVTFIVWLKLPKYLYGMDHIEILGYILCK